MFDANFITLATRAMLGAPAKPYNISLIDIDYVAVKVTNYMCTPFTACGWSWGVTTARVCVCVFVHHNHRRTHTRAHTHTPL